MRETLLGRLERLGDRTAVVHEESSGTYGELAGEIRRIETMLDEAGVKPHDPVVLKGDFSFSHIAALFALYRFKAVVVPVVTFTETTLTAVRDACRPRHVLEVEAEVTVTPFDAPPGETEDLYGGLVEADSSGLVLLSSGSTGAPKAVLHNFDALLEDKIGASERVGAKPPHILLFLLADHIGGINSLLGVVRSGATAVVPARRTPEEICSLVDRYGIRLLPTSPTFLNLILIGKFHEKFDLSSLRLITYGTEPMPEELLGRVHAAFPRARLLQTFGTSETGISTTQSESSSSTYFKISEEGVEHRIVEGELQLRTKTQFMGYLNYSNESVTEDGWFRTGDLVEENEEGYIKVKGRAKEIINVGGEKVLPLELESILMGSPEIAYCAVYGNANSITGQAVHVEVKPVGEMNKHEVRRHVREFLDGKVEPFKMPAKITVIDEVPVSARFKKKRGQE
ncbi:acyl-CoA synthetase (AMP-forming)/AMP-acid ligase II [Actinopolyspora biskrensis]|uniref:Acyl-CoA synthetase (AMP-forming)/AMP-acid ligase II n=1 Tax=Actinopolyspora biskrensis TaxID=1470178 RepID=A0A852Z4L0_9ACTN|nr:long-chain fatty acid--CoA ligase [Actinopolyspora biskrensis]NYH80245.1 acyl-CoA synthetase (AMP-forming)/AMP-acid ligase II [Actinopolyspora biskrensis]